MESQEKPPNTPDICDKLTVASAPATKIHRVSDSAPPFPKRSNSCVEAKFKFSITSDRLAQLRRNVDQAIREKKLFSIKGGWQVIRRELLKRNWIEKIESPLKPKSSQSSAQGNREDDITSNLPCKQEWETQAAYIEKCERTIMSRMVQCLDVDFYWSMRRDHTDVQHRSNAYKLISRYSRSLFASKEGLALLLQQAYWHIEPEVAFVNFPRCYVLGFPDHFHLFVDDFRITACMSLLKWFVSSYDPLDKHSLQSPDGSIPVSCVQFAVDRCNDYVSGQKHLDIDKEIPHIWDHEWEEFLSHYYSLVHKHYLFASVRDYPLATLHANSKSALRDMAKYWPEYEIDGMRNIWILKPGNKCRGRGIHLIKSIADVEKIMTLKMKYVVQKYIERPLIIYQTKFDIRQWFLVTSVQPLCIWMYRDSYLRFSSQIFSLDNFHESLHLTNHAVQCKYTNMQQRDKALPQDNMWDCHTFKAYLKQIGCGEKWADVIYPGMREGIICAMLASQDTMDRRQNTFELYGADFMLSEDFKPWLIEINCSPDLTCSTSVTSRMCPKCLEDLIKVVIDRRKDPKADTGLFDMIYKQNLPKSPPYLGMNLSVRGRKMFKNRNRSKQSLKEKEKKQESIMLRLKRQDFIKAEFIKDATIKKALPKLLAPDIYKGPIIEDLIQELHKTFTNEAECGVDFVPAMPIQSLAKKKMGTQVKVARNSKRKGGESDAVKINQTVSLFRSQGIREKKQTESSGSSGKYFDNLAVICQLSSDKRRGQDGWEKETVSILKGKNILSKPSVEHDNYDVNKNYTKNQLLSTYDLNQLLPKINANVVE